MLICRLYLYGSQYKNIEVTHVDVDFVRKVLIIANNSINCELTLPLSSVGEVYTRQVDKVKSMIDEMFKMNVISLEEYIGNYVMYDEKEK